MVLAALLFAMAAGPLQAVTFTRVLERPDGSLITYYLNPPPEAAAYPLVVILQGSECLKVAHKYGPMIASLNGAGVGVLRVEKPGLTEETAVGTCPDEYLRLNTLDRRVLDLLAVVSALRRAPAGWNGRLGIAGGSEGGMVAAMAAPLLPETRAVVLLSSGGGMPFSEEMLLLVGAQMRASGAPAEAIQKRQGEMRRAFHEMRESPVPGREWMSDAELARNTWQWWNGALPVAAVRPLLQVSAPILMIHGEADAATPVESAQFALDEFKKRGKQNLELRRYAGVGHAPSEQAIADALRWLQERLRN